MSAPRTLRLALVTSLTLAGGELLAGDPPCATLELIPNVVPAGATFQVKIDTPATQPGVMAISPSNVGFPTPLGNLGVGPAPLVFHFIPSVPLVYDCTVPCDEILVGAVGYMQFITKGPGPGICFSNVAAVTITDSTCALLTGNHATFTQGGWGTSCSGNNPGCLRDQYFDLAFPTGLVIGDPDGVDGDGAFALHFTSSAAVQNFVPTGGMPKALSADATNPTSSAAGVFAGQLVAATLNVVFDDAGYLDSYKSGISVPLGDLVFVSNVDAALIGMTVREVIDLANQVISGAVTAPVDVNGSPVSISAISQALDALNNNFVDGTQNGGALDVATP